MRLEYFQMVDRVVELDVDGRTIKTLARVPHSSPIFEGHFPDHPLMPGVLLIECAAQASGALWASMLAADAPTHFTLAQVIQFKITQSVAPGATLETNVMLENTLGRVAQFAVTLRVEETEVARGRIVLGMPEV